MLRSFAALKIRNLFVSIIICILSVVPAFAQLTVQLDVTDTTTVHPGDPSGTILAFRVINGSVEDIALNQLNFAVEFQGSNPNDSTITHADVVWGDDEIAEIDTMPRSHRLNFTPFGVIHLSPGSNGYFLVCVKLSTNATGKIRTVVTQITGNGANTIYTASPQPLYGHWRTIGAYVESPLQVTFLNRTVAPGSMFSLPMSVSNVSSNDYQLRGGLFRFNVYHGAHLRYFQMDWQNFSSWESSWRVDGDALTVFMAGPSSPPTVLKRGGYASPGNVYMELSDDLLPGQQVTLSVSPFAFNNTLYASSIEVVITVGPHVTFGEVDGDGTFSPLDASASIDIAMGTIVPTQEQFLSDDVDGDGVGSTSDSYWMLQKLAYPEIRYPVEGYEYPLESNTPTVLAMRPLGSERFGVYLQPGAEVHNGLLNFALPSGVSITAASNMRTFTKGDTVRVGFASTTLLATDQPVAIVTGANAALTVVSGTVNQRSPVVVEQVTAVDEDRTGLPKQYSLGQNYPNPFNPSTTISYSLPKSGHVLIRVSNTLGQDVATVVDAEQSAGQKEVIFDASNLPSGMYFYRIITGEFTEVKKMMLMK